MVFVDVCCHFGGGHPGFGVTQNVAPLEIRRKSELQVRMSDQKWESLRFSSSILAADLWHFSKILFWKLQGSMSLNSIQNIRTWTFRNPWNNWKKHTFFQRIRETCLGSDFSSDSSNFGVFFMVVFHGLTDFLERLGYLGNEAKVTTWSYKGSSLSLVSWSRLEMVMWTCGKRNTKNRVSTLNRDVCQGLNSQYFHIICRGWSSTQ